MLADAGKFLTSLEKYNKDDLTEELINKLKVYIENPNFTPQKVIFSLKSVYISILIFLNLKLYLFREPNLRILLNYLIIELFSIHSILNV
jgi:hypothetical protein